MVVERFNLCCGVRMGRVTWLILDQALQGSAEQEPWCMHANPAAPLQFASLLQPSSVSVTVCHSF